MFDEMLGNDGQNTRQPYEKLMAWLDEQDLKKLSKKSATAEELFRRVGITFNVYGDQKS